MAASRCRRRSRADGLTFVKQQPQLGTGHALTQALPHLGATGPDAGALWGRAADRRGNAGGNDRGRRRPPDPADRRARRPGGLRPHRAQSPRHRLPPSSRRRTPARRSAEIREINTGIMALPAARLEGWLSKLTNRNAQREYYLTDVVPLALADRVAVAAVKARAAWEILGVNSKQQLARARAHLPAAAGEQADGSGRHARRPDAHRRARQPRLRRRCAHRRQLRVRGRGAARRTASRSGRIA